VEYIIKDKKFCFVDKVLQNEEIRNSYFQLAKKTFGIKFDEWFQSGYWSDSFIPYVLLDGNKAVSSISVCINDVKCGNQTKRYVQLSTVMTDAGYRNKGLNRWLMEVVLKEWKDKCDAVYLYANDSVVNFYPQFGFEEFTEYQYKMLIRKAPVQRIDAAVRKLDITSPDDWNLIMQKYALSNPFTRITIDNPGAFVFHCIQSFTNDIYYIEQFEAVVIAEYDGKTFKCYDIFTDYSCKLEDILGALILEKTKIVFLGFTPTLAENCIIESSQEKDTHLFILKDKENIFIEDKIMFPILSRA